MYTEILVPLGRRMWSGYELEIHAEAGVKFKSSNFGSFSTVRPPWSLLKENLDIYS
jgi:hypothetical protein